MVINLAKHSLANRRWSIRFERHRGLPVRVHGQSLRQEDPGRGHHRDGDDPEGDGDDVVRIQEPILLRLIRDTGEHLLLKLVVALVSSHGSKNLNLLRNRQVAFRQGSRPDTS